MNRETPVSSERQHSSQSLKIQNEIMKVHTWLERMTINVARATNLSSRLSFTDMNESNDLFWALAKYTENVQECAKKLDCLNHNVLEALEEVPLKSDRGEDLTWKNMKGMRDIIAHRFWGIDQRVLWETTTKEFLVLRTLLSRLTIGATPADQDSVILRFPAHKIIDLPTSPPGDENRIGNCLIMMLFDQECKAWCLRIAKLSSSRLAVKPPGKLDGFTMSISLIDDDQEEFLGSLTL